MARKAAVRAGNVRLKRAYEKPARDDGTRILIDRLWPRGVRKADAELDQWAPKITAALRKLPELKDVRSDQQTNGLQLDITIDRDSAARHGITAVVVMAENATPSKVAATRAYGAEVVLHGTIWDEANEKAKQLVAERGYTYIHPFDDEQLIVGQGTVGLEIHEDWPEVELAIVPIGGGGLISGVAMAVKGHDPRVKVIGVESSDGPAMQRSLAAGHLETIDCKTIIDGLRVRRAGEINFSVVQRFVDEVVALPDAEIFDAMIWTMERCKLVVEGAAAAPVAALLHGLVKLPVGSRVAAVLSGGNLNLDQLRSLRWN